jgi:hypothetical protein
MNSPPSTRPTGDLLAFDVGGANLKAADGLGRIHAEGFQMWRRPHDLAARLAGIAAEWRPRRIIATMTGEIADCFPDRAAGVGAIVAALGTAADGVGAALGIYAVDGRIVTPSEAVAAPHRVAASNWHALARLAAHHAGCDQSLLIDVGSTTTDILLLDRHGPMALAEDDAGRMASGELVYTGIERTPVAALVRSLPLAGRRRPVASELYARSQDAWLLAGGLPETPASTDTADGGPVTREAARVRMARMALLEPALVTLADAQAAAEHLIRAQTRLVALAIRRVLSHHRLPPQRLVLSGHGTALAERAIGHTGLDLPIVRLDTAIGPQASRAAPAHALALIARGDLR